VTPKPGAAFDDQDRAILDQLVHLTAVAIENGGLYRDLRENDRRREQFLAMLARELRNPLGAIGNAVTLCRRNGQHDHLQCSIDVIDRQVHHLTRLIDDLLDVSRIMQGKIRLRREPVDLTSVVANAIEAVRPLIEERKHELQTVVPCASFWIEGDPTRLEQMVASLFSNALKYTERAGQIRLTMSRENKDIIIRVKDSGVGIPRDLLPRIFDLFTQGDRSPARSEGGLGIGLALV
jgi:signal transduction histidine kinase